MGDEIPELGFRRGERVVFFTRPGLSDFFTKGAGMLTVERLPDRDAERIRPGEVANHVGPGDALKDRQMPAGG